MVLNRTSRHVRLVAAATAPGDADEAEATVDASTLGELFIALRPEIERFLRRRVQCPHLAADMASDLYLKLDRAGNFQGSVSEARRYLFKMASNHSLDHLRVEARRAEILRDSRHLFDEIEPGAERGAMAKSELELVRSALNELPEKMRRMLVLSRVHGMTQAEIAAEMGVSKSLVEKYLVRSLLHCRQRMEELGDGSVVAGTGQRRS